MTHSTPRVSIGMPVYSAGRYLSEALDSLLHQTFTDFEIVISDNASQDDTESICRAYVENDRRIRYERMTENLGAIRNFNRVFECSRGEYFKWASYDDICRPTFLERCVELLDRDRKIVWCHTDSGKIDAESHELAAEDPAAEGLAHTSQIDLPRENYNSARPHRRYEGVLLGTNWCVDSYGLIRAAALRGTSLLPACYGAEKVLMGALSLRGHYGHIPETLFFQRVHPAASSSLNSAADQLTFMDTVASRRFASTRFKLLAGHRRAVADAELTGTERARCYLVIARYLGQVQKWKHIVFNTLKGRGVGRLDRGGAGAEHGASAGAVAASQPVSPLNGVTARVPKSRTPAD